MRPYLIHLFYRQRSKELLQLEGAFEAKGLLPLLEKVQFEAVKKLELRADSDLIQGLEGVHLFKNPDHDQLFGLVATLASFELNKHLCERKILDATKDGVPTRRENEELLSACEDSMNKAGEFTTRELVRSVRDIVTTAATEQFGEFTPRTLGDGVKELEGMMEQLKRQRRDKPPER